MHDQNNKELLNTLRMYQTINRILSKKIMKLCCVATLFFDKPALSACLLDKVERETDDARRLK